MKNEVDINGWYKFTDDNGEDHVLKGSNPFVQESITRGLPISINDKGEYFIDPYIELTGGGIVAHMPNWFKKTPQYKIWTDTWVPTIKNAEIDSYGVSKMNDVLKRLSNEAAPGEVTSNVKKTNTSNNDWSSHKSTGTVQPSSDVRLLSEQSNTLMIIDAIAFVASIIIAIIFASSVKNKIRQREKFSGASWGFLNGIVGVGFLWVIIAHSSINKELVLINDKRYAKFAKSQMSNFIKIYGICLGVWIIASIIILMIDIQK